MSVTSVLSYPSAATFTVKGPPIRRPDAVKLPEAVLVAVLVVPEGIWTMVIVAFATGAPSAVTVPRTVDVVSCAWTGATITADRLTEAAPAASKIFKCFI